MPSSRITATTCAICARRQMRELAVVDRDVGDAAGAVARERAAGHLAQHARRGGRRRAALRAASARPARTRSRRPPSPSRNSATAPFSATIASIGQSRANGSLQPIGRPVTATPARRRARRSPSAASASGSIAPSLRQRVVDVGQHAAHAARGVLGRRASGAGRDATHGAEVLHKAMTRRRDAGLATIAQQFRGALQGRSRGPRLETLHCNRAHPHRSLVGESPTPDVASCGSSVTSGARE